MSVAVVTGAGGLIGSETVRHFAALGLDVVGIDNGMRAHYLGPEGSTTAAVDGLRRDVPGYRHHSLDVRDRDGLTRLLLDLGSSVSLVVHAAAQPSHDWADHDPLTDFDVNVGGTVNLLNAVRVQAPEAVFVYLSTIKVYGPHPNRIPLAELPTRFDALGSQGFDESTSIDGGPHSLFGAGKTAADLMVQEYGHAYGLRTVILRPGCLTGPAHAATELHGMLGYLMRAVMEQRTYRIIGYGGKQVRDQLHTADVSTAIEAIWRDPPEPGEVFNLGGGRGTDVSVLEALAMAEEITGKTAKVEHVAERRGDHRWWVTDTARFRARYPQWGLTYQLGDILQEIHDANVERWR